jgi:hypothetical protein
VVRFSVWAMNLSLLQLPGRHWDPLQILTKFGQALEPNPASNSMGTVVYSRGVKQMRREADQVEE